MYRVVVGKSNSVMNKSIHSNSRTQRNLWIACIFLSVIGLSFLVRLQVQASSRLLATEMRAMGKALGLQNQTHNIPDSGDTSEIDFGCQAPASRRLQSGCWLQGARGKYTGRLREDGGLYRGKSQGKEDMYLLEEFFWGKTGGTFIEMGALDGQLYSNSYYFEKSLNWTGVLIEGSPKNYAKLIRNRPQSVCVNAMICGEKRELHYIDRGAISGAWELMSEDFRSRWHSEMTPERVAKLPTVPCVSLSDVLGTNGVKHVDFFSLDVEGAEASVLRTLDFATFSASVILLEARQKAESFVDIMKDAGYVYYGSIGLNQAYLHPRFMGTLPAKT